MKAYSNWVLSKDEQNVVWLAFDKKDSSVNTLSKDVLMELKDIVAELRSMRPSGLVLTSAKKSGFIAGADVREFSQIKTQDAAIALIAEGQQIFNDFAELPFKKVALISGFCLGGGCELVLCCDFRIAEDSPKTKIGLPEVKLGIHPGWGGTVRLPELVGILPAMELILSGRILNAKQAKKKGCVDAISAKRQMLHTAKTYITKDFEVRTAPWWDSILNLDLFRPLLGKFLRRQLQSKIREEHYPAPFAVLQNWVDYGLTEESYATELKSIGELLVSPACQNLVRVFFLQERMKSLAKAQDFKGKHVHVIGAGTMGGDIAAWCAFSQLKVTLQDTNRRAIADSYKRAHKLYQKKLKQPHLVQAALDRFIPDPEGTGILSADLIIEAIVENAEAKSSLFQQIELQAKDTTIFATNTSTIPLNEISQGMKNPGRVIGIHFFNPVTKMQLVEIVSDKKTNEKVVMQAMSFVRKIDKLPLPVKSSPGFLVNRVLMPYLLESIQLLDEGVPAEVIDAAALQFGMPMGPIELADTIGLDVCVYAANSLQADISTNVKNMVTEGRLGKKTNIGFYQYKKGKKIKKSIDPNYTPPEDLSDRLVFRLINEASACLRENIISDADLLDAGMIFGTGFSPFYGGPLNYVNQLGVSHIKDKMNILSEKHGSRFKTDQGLGNLVERTCG